MDGDDDDYQIDNNNHDQMIDVAMRMRVIILIYIDYNHLIRIIMIIY